MLGIGLWDTGTVWRCECGYYIYPEYIGREIFLYHIKALQGKFLCPKCEKELKYERI